MNEKYWFVGFDSTVREDWWADTHFDNNLYSFGNFFPTQEKAEEAARKIKELLKSL